jgi:hypothetical protein
VKDGRLSAAVSDSVGDPGQPAVENAIALLRGQQGAEKIADTPARPLTGGNADRADAVPVYRATDCSPPG